MASWSGATSSFPKGHRRADLSQHNPESNRTHTVAGRHLTRGAGAMQGAHIPKARPGLSRTTASGSQPARGKGARAGLWGPRSTPLGPEQAGAMGRARAAPGPASFGRSQGSTANEPVDFWGLPALRGWSQSQAPRADVLRAAARPTGTQTRSSPRRLPARNSTDPPGPRRPHPFLGPTFRELHCGSDVVRRTRLTGHHFETETGSGVTAQQASARGSVSAANTPGGSLLCPQPQQGDTQLCVLRCYVAPGTK